MLFWGTLKTSSSFGPPLGEAARSQAISETTAGLSISDVAYTQLGYLISDGCQQVP